MVHTTPRVTFSVFFFAGVDNLEALVTEGSPSTRQVAFGRSQSPSVPRSLRAGLFLI